MALVTQPLGSSEARGSVGGLTYNTWRGKHTVKTRSGPARLPTALQLEVLAYAATARSIWITSDQTFRDRWNAYAAQAREPHWTGNDKRITGYNWFTRCYVRAVRTFATYPTDPPSSELIAYCPTFEATAVGSDVILSWASMPGFPDASHQVTIYRDVAASDGCRPYIKNAQFLASNDYTDDAYTDPDTPVGTLDYWARVQRSDGLVSVWSHARTMMT